MNDLILASQSPRRHELIASIGLRYTVEVADIDESALEGETVDAYVERLAREKALTVAQRMHTKLPVLGADTIVTIDGELLGKPTDEQHARAMLERLSGRTHVVYTGVAVVYDDKVSSVVQSNNVRFGVLDSTMIDWYLSTGESMDKAGAYAVQGKGGVFIEHIEGSFTGVMGLPLYETHALLTAAGVTLP